MLAGYYLHTHETLEAVFGAVRDDITTSCLPLPVTQELKLIPLVLAVLLHLLVVILALLSLLVGLVLHELAYE